MGNRPSLDGEVAEVKDIVAEFTAAFVKHYSKFYTIGLARKQKRIMEKEAAGTKWKLDKFEGKGEEPPVKTGIIVKRSKHLKKWNERFFVVRGDYIIDYYAKEEDFNKNPGKPLGSFNMSIYDVVRDVNDTLINRIIALAEKCDLNVDDFPKPEKFPDFTFALHNERKEEVYIKCKSAEEHKEWCDIFERARWRCSRYNNQDDKVHLWAFPKALWRARWDANMWGWWYGGGGEQEMIASCINQKIMWQVMGKVDAKLRMPWSVRSRIRNGFMKTTDGIVNSAVGPAWKGCYDAVCKAAPAIEEKLKEMLTPIVEAEGGLMQEITGMVESGAKDSLGEKVTPNLQPLLDIVFKPVNDAVKQMFVAFEKSLEKAKESGRYRRDEKRNLIARRWYWSWEFYAVERMIGELYDPLYAMRKVFDEVSPWRITGRAQRRMRKIQQNALYTFEKKYEELRDAAKEANPDSVPDDKINDELWQQAIDHVKPLLMDDCRTAVLKVLGYILFGVVEDMWTTVVIKPARALVEPLSSKVPDALKDFIDPNDLLERVLNNILMTACALVFEPCAAKISIE